MNSIFNTVTLERHIQIVGELVKKPNEIYKEFSSYKASILHPVMGITGEWFELIHAIKKEDWENFTEEAGDMFFYITDLRIVTKSTYTEGRHKSTKGKSIESQISECIDCIFDRVSGLFDLTKKIVIYNKDSTNHQIVALLDSIEYNLVDLISMLGFSLENIIQNNSNKLKDGPNARYKDGYSDRAAKERADKKEKDV